jgi:antirestriction protein ArdC
MDSQQSSNGIDVYQIVTDRIIELLEQGTVPWRQPWQGVEMPMNMLSRRWYRGINQWLLLSLQYERNLYLTWDQLKALGASVNAGEHGNVVVFWKNIKKEPEELDENKKPKVMSVLRYYKVFNIAQCNGIPEQLIPKLETSSFDPIASCDKVIAEMPLCPEIRHKEQKAFYNIKEDFINMPRKKSFKTPEGYYSTLLHELTHSTGAEKRLNRKTLVDVKPFGMESYALEELVAEMGSAFLCFHTGILPAEIDNAAAYLKGWLQILKNDKRFIITAAGQAQKAADYILGKTENESIIERHYPVETVIS